MKGNRKLQVGGPELPGHLERLGFLSLNLIFQPDGGDSAPGAPGDPGCGSTVQPLLGLEGKQINYKAGECLVT